jgi:hypothetical protein
MDCTISTLALIYITLAVPALVRLGRRTYNTPRRRLEVAADDRPSPPGERAFAERNMES